jgi:hypothetical protein
LFVVGETRYGMMQYRRNDRPVGICLDRYGEYLQRFIDLLADFLRPGMAVIETAPGIGAHSVPLASILGAAGHLMLYEQDRVSTSVLRQNLHIAGAINVTIMPEADQFEGLDDLGLRSLDLLKVNGMRHGETLGRSDSTLQRLRPFVFLESRDPSCFDAALPQLEPLDYRVQCMAVPYYDPNNFRANSADELEGAQTFAILAIPRERDPC